MADKPSLAGRHVDEHASHGTLATAHQVGIGRDLLKEMALAGAAWPQLDHIVVALDEGHHAQQQHIALALGHLRRLKANAAQQKMFPLLRRQAGAAFVQGLQHIACGKLDRTQRGDGEWAAIFLLSDDRIVRQIDLGVEAAGQHALVLLHELIVDAHISQLQARQRGQIGVGARIQPGRDEVDQLDHALFAGARFEELFLTAANRPFP